MRRASVVPVSVAVTIVMLCIVLVFMLSRPVEAQTDPLAGQTVNIQEDENGNVASVGPISVAECEADPNVAASLLIEDADGRRATFTDGDGARFRFGLEGISIAVLEGGNTDVPGGFAPGTGEVISSTGITCGIDNDDDDGGGGGNGGGASDPDGDQYGDDREVIVIDKTIPDKPLPKTGGIPPLLGAGVLLACAALASVRILRR